MYLQKRSVSVATVERKQRMVQVIESLEKAETEGKTVSLKQFEAVMGIDLGLSSKKVKEYLDQLSDASYIEINKSNDTIRRL